MNIPTQIKDKINQIKESLPWVNGKIKSIGNKVKEKRKSKRLNKANRNNHGYPEGLTKDDF